MSVVAAMGFLGVGAALLGFVALADEVMEGDTQRMDEALLKWVAAMRRPGLDPLALQITALGNVATIILVGLMALALLWAAKRRVSAVLLLLSLGTGTAVTFLLKTFFDRPRPQVVTPIAGALTSSFPSGHAMMSAVTYGTVAYLVGRTTGRRARWLTWTGAGVTIVLVGLSRLYVGVHYPSDVLAGWLGGVAWVGMLTLLFRFLGAFATEAPEIWAAEAKLEGEPGPR